MTNSMSINLPDLSFIDLTHTLSSSIPHWSGGCGFKHSITSDYSDSKGKTKFHVQSINMFGGIGTHMDAPLHCIPGAIDIASIPLSQLIAPCIVIDVSSKADENYVVTIDDIKQFESQHGLINKNSFVIIHTGWGNFWSNPKKYRNNLLFPTISIQAAELLLQRDIVGLGIDTLSPDNEKQDFPIHYLILSEGKYIIENVANASKIPPTGASTIALPIKIQEGTESPIRLVAAVCNKI